MEIVKSLKRAKRRGRHAPLPRKAVERRCYICVRLRRPVFERQADGVARQFAFIHFVNSHEFPNGLVQRIAFLESVDYARAGLIKREIVFCI